MSKRHQITYNHIMSADGIEGFVRIPIADILKAATSIWMKENLDSRVLEAAHEILVGNGAELESTNFHEGQMLFMKAVDMALEERPPHPSNKLRQTALAFLQDQNHTQPILDLLQNQPHPIKTKNGFLEDGDLKAITFLIFNKTDKPGEFARTLSQIFKEEPPHTSITHRMFTDILLKRVRDYLASQEKDDTPEFQHRTFG